MRLVTILVTMLVLIPLTSSGFTGGGIISNAQAANACSGEWQPVVWNETMQRVAEVPFQNSYNDYYYDDEYHDFMHLSDGGGWELTPDLTDDPLHQEHVKKLYTKTIARLS